MGASQSSSKDGGSEQEVKTSYYELLGVERQATEDELKKAYRRKALELHPDRNYGNEEYTTKVFAEVQAAYEVLSDPQERAWYDSHESAILRGEKGGDDEGVPTYQNIRITTADDLARMLRKFNSNVEYTDAPSGFFGFLRDTFQQLAKEEEAAADWENAEARDYPSFGHKDDNYDDVVKMFYAAWASFSTVKSFAWKDKYRLSEAPDRWYRRRMEQENKKARQDGIREFNDAVRSLVAFVRKRDPRYVPSTQTEAERQKILRDAAAAQAARARAANEAKMTAEVPEWTKSREPDPLADLEGNFDEQSEEEEVFECVACNKIFKSEKQYEAHEKSKKHQKAVNALQKKMRKENATLDLNGSGLANSDIAKDEKEMEDSEDTLEDTEARGARTNGHAESEMEGDIMDVKSIIEDSPYKSDETDVVPSGIGANIDDEEPESEEDPDYASPDAIQARLQSTVISDAQPTPMSDSDNSDDPQKPTIPEKKMGKAAQKRAKKAAAAATSSQAGAGHKCAGCDKVFTSKTILFQHLKDHPKHAALKPVTGGGGGGKKKGKTKR